METDYQQRYRLELAQKTLQWGRWVAIAAIIFIVLFYFGDINELKLENTLPWRCLGLVGPFLYLLSRIIPSFRSKVIEFYSLMMILIMIMMSIIAVQIFTNPSSTDHQIFAITTGYMSVWILIALIAVGGRELISVAGSVILLATISACLIWISESDKSGFVFSMLMAGMFSVITMRVQARNDRERAFSVYALQESRDKIKDQAEDLQLANDNLVTFTRAMSHDLQSPLRSVRSFLDLYKQRSKGRLPEDTQEYLDLASHYLQRGQEVVSDLLTYSKIGKDPIVKKKIELKGFYAQHIKELKESLEDKEKYSFTLDLQATVLRADEKLLWHVCANLLSNAIKFSKEEEAPEISIVSTKDDKEIVLEIRDNGVGFDQDFSKELGKPFTRLHGNEFSGTGIGLSIVRQVMELHEGRFWACSEPGKGASFFCAFPDHQIV